MHFNLNSKIMIKNLLYFVLFVSFVYTNNDLKAQSFDADKVIYGSSPFQDSLWGIDTTTWDVKYRIAPTLPGFSITGCNGIAFDPETYQTFIIMKVTGVTGRVLGTIDLKTGICTEIGNLGDNFSSITFRENGQLYGVTGDGATVPETLYLIDKLTGVPTLLTALGNGADGEVICYNRADDYLYHWSGNGTLVFEKILPDPPYTITNIPVIGTTGGETFGSMYNNPDQFIISNIASHFKRLSTTGEYSNDLNTNPDDLRGIVMVPNFVINDDSICQRVGALEIKSACLQLFDSVYYHWGDGTIDSVTTTTESISHIYSATGSYTVSIELANGVIPASTFTSFTLVVKNTPGVTLSGSTNLCSGSTVLLSGTSGGTSQWYMNGTMIPGATSNTYLASVSGSYNMTKTNLAGCRDTAQVPKVVVDVLNPVITLGHDTTVCGAITLNAMNTDASYLWTSGNSQQTETITSSGTYSVTVTDLNNCHNADTILINVNDLPLVNLGADASVCFPGILLDAMNTGAATVYVWSTGGSSQTEQITETGIYSVLVTDVNACSMSDTISVVVNSNPVVALGNDTTGCASVLITPNMSGYFLWSDDTTNPDLLVTSTGTYHVTVFDSNGCLSSDTINVTINALPIVSLTILDSTLCYYESSEILTGLPSGGTFSGTSVSGNQFDPSVGIGLYDIIYLYTDGNGCASSDTMTIEVSTCVGINENLSNMFGVYPNPSNGVVILTIPLEGATIELSDYLGNIIEQERTVQVGDTSLDLSGYPNGVYLISFNTNNMKITKRIVVIH